MLHSTLGNLPEFFVVLFALSAGELVIAQTAIIGSVFANALLVLGLVVIAGCRASADGVMRFSPGLSKDNTILMMLASFLIVIIGISTEANDGASHHVEEISIVGALALLATYAVWIVGYIRADHGSGPKDVGAHVLPTRVSLTILALAGLGSAFVSEWFVDSLSPSMARLGVPQAFAGLVIVAIAGNAVENATGVVLASRGKADLAVSVVTNSVAQITAFLFPALVLASLLFSTRLTFPARARLHRRARAHRDRALGDHERRRSDAVRRHGARRALRDPRRPHLVRVARPGSRASRPPVSPDGRRISTAAITTPIATSRVPVGRCT